MRCRFPRVRRASSGRGDGKIPRIVQRQGAVYPRPAGRYECRRGREECPRPRRNTEMATRQSCQKGDSSPPQDSQYCSCISGSIDIKECPLCRSKSTKQRTLFFSLATITKRLFLRLLYSFAKFHLNLPSSRR